MTSSVVEFFEREMVEPESHRVAGGTACIFTVGCSTTDGPNEDAAALIPVGEESGVLVVADGMGGGVSGQVASRTAAQAVAAAVDSKPDQDTLLRTALINGFETANAAVRELAGGAATTLVAVEISTARTVRPYHVGDSAILIVGGRGKIKYKSIPHSPTGYAVESGLIDESEAIAHDERHLVSNVVGTGDMRIDIGPVITLAPRDTVLLTSDGVVDNLMFEEIAEFARLRPLERAVKTMAEAASRRMAHAQTDQPSKPDDLTILAYRPN